MKIRIHSNAEKSVNNRLGFWFQDAETGKEIEGVQSFKLESDAMGKAELILHLVDFDLVLDLTATMEKISPTHPCERDIENGK